MGTARWNFAVGNRDWTQLPMQHGQVGCIATEQGGGSADGNLLGGNIRCKGPGGKGSG